MVVSRAASTSAKASSQLINLQLRSLNINAPHCVSPAAGTDGRDLRAGSLVDHICNM